MKLDMKQSFCGSWSRYETECICMVLITGHEVKFCSHKNRHGEDLLCDESYISYYAKPERSILNSHQTGHKRIVLYIIILLCWPQVRFHRNNGTFDDSKSSTCLLYLEPSPKAAVADCNYDNLWNQRHFQSHNIYCRSCSFPLFRTLEELFSIIN